MNKLKVKSAPGRMSPYHDRPGQYIPTDKFVEVENLPFYRKAIADGDLLVDSQEAVSEAKKGAK